MQALGYGLSVISHQESKRSNLLSENSLDILYKVFLNKYKIDIIFHLGMSFNHTQVLTLFGFYIHLLTLKRILK